ncbi:MAG: hypothetical protein ACOCZ8_04105 [Bacteroidota bacterium]
MGKTRKISLEEAKAQFEELLEKLLVGKSVSIAAEGEQPVELRLKIQTSDTPGKREYGKLSGEIELASPEEEAAFDKELEALFYDEKE